MANGDEEAAGLLPLTPQVFQILLALADGDRHGYAIMQEVEARTEGRMKLGAGTLYGAIKRLRQLGLIEERDAATGESAEARRRTYGLTVRGRAVAVAESKRLERLVEAARTKRLIPRPA